MGLYVHRLIIVVPAALKAAFGAWYAANVDPNDDWSTQPPLNPSGLPADPATHYWSSTALVDADLKAVLLKACTLTGTTPPTNGQWAGWTRAEKVAWLAGVRDAMFSGFGIWLDLCQNDGGAWNDPQAALAKVGVKVKAALAQAVP